jgi:hypothetical protein
MLTSMIIVFIIMTVLFIPNIGFYMNGKGLESLRNYNSAQFTLGNLGFSSYECSSQYTKLTANRTITCETGRLTELYSAGLMPSEI